MDPSLLRLRGADSRFGVGRGVVGCGIDASWARDVGLHAGDRGDVCRKRHVSPCQLGFDGCQELDEAAGPLDDLCVHRWHLYAVRPAGHATVDWASGVGDRVGRGAGRSCADAVLARRPALAGRGALFAAGLGSGLVRRRRSCRTLAWPRPYCSRSAARFTALVRCFTHYAGPTRGLRPSAITRYFTG